VASSVKVIGLDAYLKPLKGKAFKDVNRELRQFSKLIAADIKPLVEDGVAASPAPQAAAMSKTVRVHSDRVPVLVVGKVNPRFRSGFRRGSDSRKRRGALAAGVVKGGKGGRRSTARAENYYAPQQRDESWGALGRALRNNGPILREAEDAYLRFYMATLKRYGFKTGRR
jgi:hypothetical protein